MSSSTVWTRSRLWLPFTQMEAFDSSQRTFVRGEGSYLVDSRDRRVFDAVSSIWTTIHGHCHPHIVEAIARQARALDHATTLGATNPVAEELAACLCSLTGLDYAFFASDGASAIEAALKMAIQYWQQRGQPQRTRFVRMVNAYHGDTAGAMSVSDIAVFREHFGAVTFETRRFDERDVLSADDVAAVIVEPLVHAAAGMRVVDANAYGVFAGMKPLLIVDEIATGFGRTGTMFAFEQTAMHPDIVCLGKGITGGTLALSATLARSPIYDAFLGEYAENKQFFHGHSYAGNPIACAAALASLDLFEVESTFANVARVCDVTAAHLRALEKHPRVRETRQAGLMIGIVLDRGAWDVERTLYERGFFTRPIGNVVQFVPPLSTTPDEATQFFAALSAALA